MKVVLRILAWIAGGMGVFAAIAIGGFWLFLEYTAEQMCGNQIISNTNLPDLNKKVVVFQRDCGATTGFSKQVSILEIDKELPNESGNIFTADTDHGKAPSGKGGGPEARVEVLSGNSIKILHHKNARIFNHRKQWESIEIEYGAF